LYLIFHEGDLTTRRRCRRGFVRACWLEVPDERLVGCTGAITEEERAREGIKTFGAVLVRWTRLDEA
jgi:hypothetical protein